MKFFFNSDINTEQKENKNMLLHRQVVKIMCLA